MHQDLTSGGGKVCGLCDSNYSEFTPKNLEERAICRPGAIVELAKSLVEFKTQTWMKSKGIPPSALDVQIGGDHYRTCKIQPIEYIYANKLDFLPGCIIKRITRFDKPTGKGLQDLQKIKHEVDLIIELTYSENTK
jgi:hypothetical protein